MSDGGIIEAVVQVGAQETHYLRCGRGDRVVVVLSGDAAERLRLMNHYADGGRVIAPVPPVRDAVADWIRGVIDGLGLDRPEVVLAADLAWLAERLVDGGDAFELVQAAASPSR